MTLLSLADFSDAVDRVLPAGLGVSQSGIAGGASES
jgi:hypothetical protein